MRTRDTGIKYGAIPRQDRLLPLNIDKNTIQPQKSRLDPLSEAEANSS